MYFTNTPALNSMEAIMKKLPYGTQKGGGRFRRLYQYTKKDCDCRLCLYYRKKNGCALALCPVLDIRLGCGAATIGDAVKDVFKDAQNTAFQKRLSQIYHRKDDAEMIFQNNRHKQIFEAERLSMRKPGKKTLAVLYLQLYREILAVADENGGRLPNRAMFYCDEFGTLPTIQSAEMMYSASRSRRLSIVSIIQSYQQLEKNYGREGAEIIKDNCQITIAGGFAPSSETAEIISKSLGSRTVMTGSVSRGKNDPSQSLQMTERPLMTADELKSMKKGSFIVMKTGAHPFVSQLKLFFKWGISFPKEAYTVTDQGARKVCYTSREKLIRAITKQYPQEKKPYPRATNASGGQSMTEPAEATTAQEINHAAQQAKAPKPVRTG